jgi:hypothetical protein
LNSAQQGASDNQKQRTKMNRNRVPTTFGPETRFEVNATPAAPFRAVLENEFERLNAKLIRERLADRGTAGLGAELRRAANEAAGLAWATAFPLLFFPALFEEKVRVALRRMVRQEEVRAETRELVTA